MNVKKIYWFLKTQILRFQYGKIGKKSYIGKELFIQRKKNLIIGSNVRIYPGLRAEMTMSSAKILISDNVSIGQNFHVVSYDGILRIGENSTISGNVFISNVDHDYQELGKHILEQPMLMKETIIGENCFIGYGAVVLPGSKLGKQCIIGANSVVKGTFQDNSVIVGNPARIVKRYNQQTGNWEKITN